MLQRRIGMIWTSSGCSVFASPRRNSRTDRSRRLVFRTTRMEPLIISGGLVRLRLAAHGATDPQGGIEDRADPDPEGQLVVGDRGEPSGRDAPALRAVRVSAELTRRDRMRQIGGNAGGGLREDALV